MILVVILRTALVAVGAFFLFRITNELLHGGITYSLGELIEERVTTKTIPEGLAVWAAFGSIFVAMIIGGARPQLYVEKPWLWKALLSVIAVGYVGSSLLR